MGDERFWFWCRACGELCQPHPLSPLYKRASPNHYTPKYHEPTAPSTKTPTPTRVQVDGGVGVANIKEIAEAGADFFVAGSAILKNPRTQEVRG